MINELSDEELHHVLLRQAEELLLESMHNNDFEGASFAWLIVENYQKICKEEYNKQLMTQKFGHYGE